MKFRTLYLYTLGKKVLASLWFVPGVCTIVSVALGMTMVEIDRRVLASENADVGFLLYGVGASGAREILGSIAGAIITVTGVVFSVTVVTLQLASTQYTPRILHGFIEDRRTQLVLGVFLGTFTYCLVVLRTVRARDEDMSAFVPSLSVTLAMGLALLSIAFLILFVHHIATSIQDTEVARRAAKEALSAADLVYPADDESEGFVVSGRPDQPSVAITAASSGFLQNLDEEALWNLCCDCELVVRLDRRIGEFVVRGETLATVWPAASLRDGTSADAVRDCFELGSERTTWNDVERGIRQLSDIAVRALSPGINDPTTAELCIDRLVEVLAVCGNRNLAPRVRVMNGGNARMILLRASYEDLVRLAFERIRHYGGGDPGIVRKLLEAHARLARLVRDEHRAVLLHAVRETLAGTTAIKSDAERARVASYARGIEREVAEGQEDPGRDCSFESLCARVPC